MLYVHKYNCNRAMGRLLHNLQDFMLDLQHGHVCKQQQSGGHQACRMANLTNSLDCHHITSKCDLVASM